MFSDANVVTRLDCRRLYTAAAVVVTHVSALLLRHSVLQLNVGLSFRHDRQFETHLAAVKKL